MAESSAPGAQNRQRARRSAEGYPAQGEVGAGSPDTRDPGNAGLSEPNHHALHDVQARPVCRTPVAQTARIPKARLGHRGHAVPGRYRVTIGTENGSRWMNLVPHALLSTITLFSAKITAILKAFHA